MTDQNILLEMTTKIVSSYVGANQIDHGQIAGLTRDVYNSLQTLDEQKQAVKPQKPVPAIPINDSITNDHIICLEDGQPFKSLRRHLKAKYNMEPDEYRRKWNLPPDYPMVAPSYSKRRSKLARQSKLGHHDGRRAKKK